MIDFNSRNIRIAVAVIVLIAFGSLVYYFATHGRIVIKNLNANEVSLVKLNKDGSFIAPRDVKNGAIVSSGDYIVKNNFNDLPRLAHVTIPGWLGASEITFDDIKSANMSRVAALTYEHIVPTSNGSYVSYTNLDGYTSGFTTHPPDDAFGGRSTDTAFQSDITAPATTSDGGLVGLVDSSLRKYSFTTGSTNQILNVPHSEEEHVSDVINAPVIKRSSDVNSSIIGLYERSEGKLTVIDNTKVIKEVELKITNTQSIVFDVSEKMWASVHTTSGTQSGDSPEAEDESFIYKVSIDHATEGKKDVDIGPAGVIDEIAVDPSNKYLAVNKDGQLWVYRISDGVVVMFNPFTASTQLFWDKTKLYSLSTETGINVFDTKTLQLLPISIDTPGSLSFSSVVPIGSKLYFTAYNTKQDSRLPDGYVVDLAKKSNGVTKELANKLPITTSEYDVNYLENTIYVRINYFSRNADAEYNAKVASIKSEASKRIRETISDDTLKQCAIVFIN